MNWVEISALSGFGALILAFFSTMLVWFFRHILPAYRHSATFIRNCVGVPADPKTGQAYVPGIFERLASQDKVLADQNIVLQNIVDKVEHAVQQVANSHVTNLRDDVDEVIGKVDSLHQKVDALHTDPGGTP